MMNMDIATDSLTERIAGLSPAKRALLEQKLKNNGSDSEPTIPRRASRHSAPLSFAQQRLWFLDQLEPGNCAYNIPWAIRISGALSVAALGQSFDAVVARHESLRTTFTSRDGDPVQVIAENGAVVMPVVDLQAQPESEREAEARKLAVEEARRPFDLARGPLLRATLLRFGEREHVLLLTMHHIVSDAWSAGVLFREVKQLYEAFSQGRPSPLSALPIQYADYAVWQREHLRGEALERQRAYWKRQLADAPAMLELPTDRPRPAVQSFRGARQPLVLSENLCERLKTVCRQKGATLFMTLLAAFLTLLHRYTGQDDIVVGSVIANRARAEVEELIGFFLNTLALRADLSGDPSFSELLARARKVALGAYAHQDMPFEKLVEELHPERNLSRHPLFQVMFTMKNAAQNDLELPGLSLRQLEVDGGTTKFDLALLMSEEAKGLRGAFEYSTDLFDAATITRMARHFETLLEGMVADPEQPLSKLPLLAAEERRQLLVGWNNTAADYPRDKRVHELFEAQVERTPAAVAVTFEGEQLTYLELNRRANQLAHHLRALGIGPGAWVGILMERSLEMAVGVLGVLKAGAAYLPLDSAYPRERLSFMLADTQAPVLLTQKRLLNNLPKTEAKLVCLDTDWKEMARDSGRNPAGGGRADDLAYVIYTSGSTGVPKGVGMSHRALVNLLSWQLQTSAPESRARTLQFASLSFDVSFQEIFSTWCAGGELILISEETRRDFVSLLRLLEEREVTRLFLPFVALQQMAEAAEGRSTVPTSLREVVTAGEQLRITRQIEGMFSRLKDCRLHNQYGPSESHVVTAYALEGMPNGWARLPPIGRPIANTQIYLLDRYRNPVPVGVPGELYIGGEGLARGYLNRPELTAERFMANPFRHGAGERLYQTGDLARYLADGEIEYLGRTDHQVKVRGYRIELGEIEVVLGQQPGVREAAVTVREDVPGDKRLVAYVVADRGLASGIGGRHGFSKAPGHVAGDAGAGQEPAPTAGAPLRGLLKTKLPDHMVPSTFVMLDELPLTPSGKVDRRALPAPDRARADLGGAFVAPRTTLELQLAKMWEKLLGVRPIGIRDNFFDLGGHSLLAVRLFDRIEKAFGKNVPLATLFQSPTIEQLAEILSQEGWRAPWTSLVALKPGGAKPPFFCAHGGFFFYRDLVRYMDADQPFYGVQPAGLGKKQPHHTCVEEMAAHYVRELRRLQPDGPYYLGGFSFGGWVAFEMAQQLYAQGEQIGLLVLFDSFGPGYPRYLPAAQKARCHVEQMMQLRGKELLTSVRGSARTAKAKIKRKVRELTYRTYLKLMDPLPRSFRRVAGVPRLRALMSSYVPQVYPGRITLLRAAVQPVGCHYDAQSGWGGLAAGGLEIHEIPGGHGSILQEPDVRALAEKLNDCLQKAQAREISEQGCVGCGLPPPDRGNA